MYYYTLTIVFNKSKSPTHSDYLKKITELFPPEVVELFKFEDKKKDGSKCKLHVHATLKFANPIIYKTYQRPGWMLFFKKRYDPHGWDKYTKKNIA